MIQAVFPELETALKFHYILIERYGGSHGLRDQGALESALAAAQNRYFYEDADLATVERRFTLWVMTAN